MHYRSANINFMYILLFLNKLVLNIYFNFIIYDIMLLAPIGCEWKKAFFEDPNYDLNNRYRNILAIFAENITFDMIYHAHFCYIFPCFLSIDIDFIMSNKFGICDKTLTIYSKIYYESNEVVESIIWLMNFIIQEYDLVEFIQLRIKRYLNKKIKPL